MKTIFSKSKYDTYSGKKLLWVLLKDQAKFFVPFILVSPILIFIAETEVIINNEVIGNGYGSFSIFIFLTALWIFILFLSFLIHSKFFSEIFRGKS